MIVAGTGHRPNKLGGYSNDALNKLIVLVMEYLATNNITKVISGMALGWDMAIAIAALQLNLPLECAIPFKGQESVWSEDSKKLYHYVLEKAEKVTYVSDEGYSNWKMQKRNEYMVNNCDIVLAMWDGSKGGTYNCIGYAKKLNKRIINLYDNLKK